MKWTMSASQHSVENEMHACQILSAVLCFRRCRAIQIYIKPISKTSNKVSPFACGCFMLQFLFFVFASDVRLRKCAIVIHVNHLISGYGFFSSVRPSFASCIFFNRFSIVYAEGFPTLLRLFCIATWFVQYLSVNDLFDCADAFFSRKRYSTPMPYQITEICIYSSAL